MKQFLRNLMSLPGFIYFKLAFGLILAFWAFGPALNQVFRSDQWYIVNFAFLNHWNIPVLKQVFHFELFGEPRFQPLSYFSLFVIHKLCGANFLGPHLCSLFIHFLNACMVYLMIKWLCRNELLANLSAIVFLLMFIHADTIIWSHFVYIALQLLCFLSGALIFYKALPDKRGYIKYALLMIWVGMFFYEAFLIGGLILVPLFFCDQIRKNQLLPNKPFKLYFSALTIYYLLFFIAAFAFYRSVCPASSLFTVSLPRLSLGVIVFLITLRNSLCALWSYPCQYLIYDIPYLVLYKETWLANTLLVLFLAYCLGALFRYLFFNEKTQGWVFFLFINMFSYVFTIAFSRNNLYVLTQSRYTYFFDAIMVIIVFVVFADILSWVNKYKRVRIVARILIILWAGWFATVNMIQIRKFSNEINGILEPLRQAYSKLEKFARSRDYTPGAKIFFESFPHPRTDRLFLGSHIFLETMFYKNGLLTKDILQAKYVYTALGDIILNPFANAQWPWKDDFTIEFDCSLPSKFPVNLLTGENMFIGFVSYDRPSLMVGTENNADKVTSRIIVPVHRSEKSTMHIVIQRQGDELFILQDGQLISRSSFINPLFRIKDKDIFLGYKVYFPPQALGFYLENFYACLSWSKYKFLGDGHSQFDDPRLNCYIPFLNSEAGYYANSFSLVNTGKLTQLLLAIPNNLAGHGSNPR